MKRSSSLLAGVLLAVALAPRTPAAPAAPTLNEAARVFGISDEAVLRLRAGEVVTKELEPAAPTELGVALAVLVRKPLPATLAFVKSDEWFEQDHTTLAHGTIDPAAVQAGLASAGYAAADAKEVKKLLQPKAGDELNLSAAEAAKLGAVTQSLGGSPSLTDPKTLDAVNAAYREILAARLQAYHSKGLAGTVAYDRGGKACDVAARLAASEEAMKPALSKHAPALVAALDAFPEGDGGTWFWRKQVAQDRPVFALSHRLGAEAPGAVFAAERQFFVGHSWDCAFVVGGLVATDSGTLLVYANRTHVDAVGGSMGGLKRNIGRGMMEKSIKTFFLDLKKAAEAAP